MENDLKLIIDEYFNDSEYKIIDLIVRGERGTKVVEIFVDNKNGINIDDLTRINKELNVIVDEKIIIKDISKLVVSSPGTERSFKYIWQLNKHLARIIEIELNNGERIEGKLTRISEDGEGSIVLDILNKIKNKQSNSELREINFKDIKESRVKISFSK